MLCVVSDGIFEAFSPAGEEFGIRRVMQILNAAADPSQAIAHLQSAVQTWQGSEEPRDDQTIVIAARTG
jgi:serine phosphatase RsbU (regulator of sigma subunit)